MPSASALAPPDPALPDLLAELDLQRRVGVAEATLQRAALTRSGSLALLEAGVRAVSDALAARPAAAYVLVDDDLVRCATWPPEAEVPVEIPAATWTRLSRAQPTPLALADAPDLLGGLGADCALFVPIDGAAEGALVVTGDTDGAERAAAGRLAALFSTLWGWSEAEARFQRTVADLDDALFTFYHDAAGRRYAFVAPQVQAIAGVAPDALLDGEVDWDALVVADDGAAFEAHDARLRAGAPSRLDFRLRLPGGEVRWVSERATPSLDAAGRLAVGGILQDVTERKAAEATLERARRVAERAASARMAFLRTMSHELRTPLGAIRGFAELLAEEVAALDGAGDAIPEFAATIADASDRALRLVSSLLDLSRLDTGGLELARRPVDADALAAGLATRYRAAAEAKGLAFHLDRAAAPAIVLADAARLEQVLDGLLSNALKFTEAGEVRLAVESAPDATRLVVSDTGVGIGADFLDGLFEPFAQEDHRVNRRFGGSGLGLAIVHGLVGAMGGRIDVESTPGEGSSFAVTLPNAQS